MFIVKAGTSAFPEFPYLKKLLKNKKLSFFFDVSTVMWNSLPVVRKSVGKNLANVVIQTVKQKVNSVKINSRTVR